MRGAAVLWLLSVAAGCGWVGQPAQHGVDLYVHHCATCHGLAGRGDGPAAEALSPRPTDLTRSSAGLAELMRVIDGRRTVRAHGSSDMPVWGDVFVAVSRDDDRRQRDALHNVAVLAEYVLHLRAQAARAAPAS
jgi:mono/diheme cytochrome c family protein